MGAPSVEDRLKLSDLMVRYTTCLDAGDVEGVAGCFTPDGVVDSPVTEKFEGHARIRFFAERIARHKREKGAQLRHVISNMRIDVEGDRARVWCYLLDFLTIDGRTQLLSPGEYDCTMVRAGSEWLMTYRSVRMDHRFSLPWSPRPKPSVSKSSGRKASPSKASPSKMPRKGRRAAGLRAAKKSSRRVGRK